MGVREKLITLLDDMEIRRPGHYGIIDFEYYADEIITALGLRWRPEPPTEPGWCWIKTKHSVNVWRFRKSYDNRPGTPDNLYIHQGSGTMLLFKDFLDDNPGCLFSPVLMPIETENQK